jgi:hypothetical protein
LSGIELNIFLREASERPGQEVLSGEAMEEQVGAQEAVSGRLLRVEPWTVLQGGWCLLLEDGHPLETCLRLQS